MKNLSALSVPLGTLLLVLLTTATVQAQTGCHAAFSFHQTADGLSIAFTDSSLSAHTITSWSWDFGDEHTSGDQNPAHTYAHDGTFHVCLTIHNDHGCSTTFCHDVVVDPIAEPCHTSFTFLLSLDNLTVHFTDASTSAHSITSWSWDLGDGHTSSDQNPAHTYAHGGTFHVCLTIHNDHGCSATFCHDVVVDPIAEPCHAAFAFHADPTGFGISFISTSTGTSAHTTYSWDFGDGNGSTQQDPHHTYAHAGHNTVCLHINDTTTGCSSHLCLVVNVHHAGGLHPSVYPNPFTTTTTFEYELAESDHVLIDLFDLTGIRVSRIADEVATEGFHTVTLSADGLRPGAYLIRMSVGDSSLMKRITVVK